MKLVYYLYTSKDGLDKTYLWYYCLHHINKKHINKHHTYKICELFDQNSYDECYSCLFGKMEKVTIHRKLRVWK